MAVIAFDRVTRLSVCNGPIELWPGSHLEHETTKLVESVRAGNEVHMTTGALSDEQLRGTIHPALVEHRRLVAPPVHVDMRQGDVLIRDARLWHCGTPNTTVSPRYMLAIVISANADPAATDTASIVFDVGCGRARNRSRKSQAARYRPFCSLCT